jgi:hypothetical protein
MRASAASPSWVRGRNGARTADACRPRARNRYGASQEERLAECNERAGEQPAAGAGERGSEDERGATGDKRENADERRRRAGHSGEKTARS